MIKLKSIGKYTTGGNSCYIIISTMGADGSNLIGQTVSIDGKSARVIDVNLVYRIPFVDKSVIVVKV